MSKKNVFTVALNVASGLALLCAATWFSYNAFSMRDSAQVIILQTK